MRKWTGWALLFCSYGWLAAGCGGAAPQVLRGSKGDLAILKQCKPEGHRLEETDVDNDAKVDVRHFYEGEKRVCSQYNLNFTGGIDATRYYSKNDGKAVREDDDFDFDGNVDQISYFQAGKMVRKEIDADFDRSIDTWMWCDGSQVKRTERDRDRNGKVDNWEAYKDGLLVEARYDDNNDGKIERWERFKDGRLIEILEDKNQDGKIDRKEAVSLEDAGPEIVSLTCESGRQTQTSARAEAP